VRSHPLCLDHRPPLGHPETGDRIETLLKALEDPPVPRWSVDRDCRLPPDDDTLGALRWIHDAEYIDRVRRASDQRSGWIDHQDNAVSSGTFRAAVAASGLALQTALDLANRRLVRSFVVIRPPSHHAERDRARGYCFFNSVALAAEVIVHSWNLPVLVVDFDVLHGNGTQNLFYDRADVGYLSVHRYPAFPGTGTADETGEGDGAGATRNVPLAAGADDEIFCTAFENALGDLAARLRPAAVVVSAGFNGVAEDPMGGMNLTVPGYRRLTAAVVSVAEAWAEGRILSVLEGGFDLPGLARSGRAHVEELAVGVGRPEDRRNPVN
jgi:acetoin utilization deacetylase AcuC-like enzyme